MSVPLTYDELEAYTAEGRPFFLYQFSQGETHWRLTSRATDWITPPGVLGGEDGEEDSLTWAASAVSHGRLLQSSDARRSALDLTFALSDPFARRFLGPRSRQATTLTIWRGHEQLPEELRAHWKGRVVSAKITGQRIQLTCESLFSTMRREGMRAKYQRLCRHALYARGCRLDIEDYFTGGTLSALEARVLTVPEAALVPAGWFAGGVLRHAGLLGSILSHDGEYLTLAAPMPELQAAFEAFLVLQEEAAAQDAEEDPIEPPAPVVLEMAPGCDLRRDTCNAKFGNLLNFGGFPDIPGRNPFGGGSVV